MKMGIGHSLWCEVWTLIERPFQRSKKWPFIRFGEGRRVNERVFFKCLLHLTATLLCVAAVAMAIL